MEHTKSGIRCPICSKEFNTGDTIDMAKIDKIYHFDELLEALRNIMKRADVALKSNETKRGIIINAIGNLAEQAIQNAEQKGE